MKTHTLFLTLLVQMALFGQSIPFKKGKIIDDIKVKNTVGETFALYLPSTYNPEMNSAIIFIFDPSGTAINGINAFKKGAEKFGYILVCSNNSKNGSYQMNFDITNRLFGHVFSEFNIDANRIYTAGFSGGSRLASTVAILTGAVQGVIACGAGFGYELDNKPTFENKFSYVGLVGDEDMNFQEMHHVHEWLDRVNIKNALFTYKGDHRWPEEFEIDHALSWLELQAFVKGIKPTDHDLVKTLYKKDYDLAIAFENEEQRYQAVIEFERVDEVYASFFNVDSIKQKVANLKASEFYKKEWILVNEIETKEYKLSENFLDKFRTESLIGKSEANFYWWKNELKILDEIIGNTKDINLKKMYSRLRFRLYAVAYENSMNFRDSNKWPQSLYCDRLLVILHPNHPYWYFRVAESYAYNDQFNASLKNLEKAMSLGFKRKDMIETSEVFQKYHSKKKFKEFLESLDH